MRKRATSAQRETTLRFELYGGKHPKRSGLEEEAQKSSPVIIVDSPKRASNVLLTLEGASSDAYREACASLEDGVAIGGPPNADGVVREALSEIAIGLSFSARLANVGPHRPRLPNWLVLDLYVLLQKWDHPSVDTVAPNPKVAWEIIDYWIPFNKRESSIV